MLKNQRIFGGNMCLEQAGFPEGPGKTGYRDKADHPVFHFVV